MDHWPKPDRSTYVKAARAGLAADPQCEDWSDADLDYAAAEIAGDPIVVAVVEAVWEDRLPTPWAYHQTARALESHRQRAKEAEQLLAQVRELVGPIGSGPVDVWRLQRLLSEAQD